MDLRYYRDSEDLTKMLVNAALARLGANDSAAAATPSHAAQLRIHKARPASWVSLLVVS
jgi:hypothetical protein